PEAERHRRQPIGDCDHERHGIQALHQLTPQQQAGAAQRVRERRLAAQRDLLQPPPRTRAARRRRQHDRPLRDAALEGDERDLVTAPSRVLEQLEDDPLHLLDHPLRVHRPAVVDDEAHSVRRPVLAEPPAEVLRADPERPLARAYGCRAQRRVDRQVAIPPPGQPMPAVLAAPAPDERPRAPAHSRALETITAPPPREDERGIHLHRLDAGEGVRPGPELRPYLVPPATFFGVTSTSSASASRRWSSCVSTRGAGPKGSAESRCPNASCAAASTSSAFASPRPATAAAAFAHSTIVMSAR